MSDANLQAAFNAVIKDAETPSGCWVSLYANHPFYGGPEEGGWWGSDTVLSATKFYRFTDDAEKAKAKVQKLADELGQCARREYGERCLSESAWLEARGLDDDFLPEPDGPTTYFVTTEDQRGSLESQGCRHYE
jgi:hypothetical protein